MKIKENGNLWKLSGSENLCSLKISLLFLLIFIFKFPNSFKNNYKIDIFNSVNRIILYSNNMMII